jgi:hypothetical protein
MKSLRSYSQSLFLLLLAVLVKGDYKAVQVGEWNVTIDTNTCFVEVSHPLNPTAFSADSKLIQIGSGNVDQIQIIKNGDI